MIWSNDGHGHYDKILVEANVPVDVVQKAYKAACQITGVQFNHNDDFTGKKRKWPDSDKYYICTEYEESNCGSECLEILKKHGLTWKLVNEMNTEDEFYEYEEEDFNNNEKMPMNQELFINLWFWFIKLASPSIEIRQANEKDEIPCINGYWDKHLNVGYGLYS